ncbi:hypothetical protein Dda_4115 [Drechslerella dactyloides]|uniref:Uncharacterized protein n=1 Tax=Drechslerella dactyloides TaxID=74499 RepID=A0AAD6NKJ8_DREDA|nr:hypothetical protein Dda_4115 [Drechslerella dactyloides]
MASTGVPELCGDGTALDLHCLDHDTSKTILGIDVALDGDGGNISALYKLLNDTVITLLTACDEVLLPSAPEHSRPSAPPAACEKATTAYHQLFHLLVTLTASTPTIRTAALSAIAAFRDDQETRKKDTTADLGHLLIQLALVNATADKHSDDATFHRDIPWETSRGLAGPFLQEALIRNAKWVVLHDSSLEFMESGESARRQHVTFQHSLPFLRLLMLQCYFTRPVVEKYTRIKIERELGFPTDDAAETLLCEVAKIYNVDSWRGVFEYVRYEKGAQWDGRQTCQVLKESIVESGRRGYHVSTRRRRRNKAKVAQEPFEFSSSLYSYLQR